ncbi:MAG TPA: 1-(5-phosphoribosyl)-5-[(5-phosphoribosylamino)methylideneamino]imidazole-4-carboxamide isomerase [Acidobacteriota bacterium]|nr:1-(5-phosphoribosyl)-5-[(5-phosphoribosylamino)methylideneamino]imidazole-4-carboxamide isomerase [Acidobacteriota bacterium]
MLVIPAIDLIDGKCVRLLKGDFEEQITYGEDPARQASRFEAAGFQRLHVIDLEGAKSGKGENRKAIEKIVKSISLPVQVGGGIRQQDDVQELFDIGVSYLILGTIAVEEPEEVDRWVENWGGERFLVSLDLQAGRLRTRGWLSESPVDLDVMIGRIQGWKIEAVICTDIERDGTMKRPNYATYQDLLARLPATIALFAAGGVSEPKHVLELQEIGVQGAIVGRALYEGKFDWGALLEVPFKKSHKRG